MRVHFFILALFFYSCSSLDQDTIIDKECLSVSGAPSFYTKSFSSTDATLSQSGDVTVLDAKIVVKGDTVSSLFEIDAPTAGEYFLSVFMIPEDSSFYFIRCNGNDSNGLLRPKKTGWQSILLADDDGNAVKVLLKQGKNEITFHSSSKDFPEIEIVRMTKSESEIAISTEAYDRYVEKLLGGTIKTKNTSLPILPSLIYNTIGYQFELDCPLLYSFTKTIVLTADLNQISVSTWVTSPIIIYIYKNATSSQKLELNGPGTVSTFVSSGTYTVHLRCEAQDGPFVAPININYNGNTDYGYSLCPVSGHCFETQPDNYTGGQVNFFTSCSSAGTNPIMYLEDFYGGAVRSINDNYTGTGDYNWGTNARIKTGYNSSPLVHIFNASASLPEGTCDLYVRVPFQDISAYIPTPFLANHPVSSPLSNSFTIKQDDTLLSGNSTDTYNCVAWAGDIIDAWVWPLRPDSPYYVEGTSPLGLFDGYFVSRGYSRTNYQGNAGIALWENDYGFTHTSIRKNARTNYPHGYDWESKIGYLPRIFHEKDALEGPLNDPDKYGQISYYYEHNPSLSVTSYISEEKSFSEKSKELLIKQIKCVVTKETRDAFNNYYDKWESFCLSPNSLIHSNPDFWMNDDSFRDLKAFCLKNQNASILLVIEQLLLQEIRAGYLLDEIFPESLKDLKRIAYLRYKEGMKILPTSMGNFIRLAEAYLTYMDEPSR